MRLCPIKIVVVRNLDGKILDFDVTKDARPMRRAFWMNWFRVGWHRPRYGIVFHSNQHKSSSVCLHVTPNLIIKIIIMHQDINKFII